MTSTEQLTAAIDALNGAAAAYNSKVAEIDAALSAVSARYQAWEVNIYVDPVLGSDANVGTPEAPVATIQRAIDLAPFGVALVKVFVRGDYTTTARLVTFGRNVRLYGCAAGQSGFVVASAGNYPTLTLGVGEVDGRATTFGFNGGWDTTWSIWAWTLVWPDADAVAAAHPAADLTHSWSNAIFSTEWSGYGPPGKVHCRSVDFTVPANPFGTLVSDTAGWEFSFPLCSFNRTIHGFYHPEIPALSLPEDYGHLVTTKVSPL